MLAAVHDPRSLGVHLYVERLAQAISALGVPYRSAARADRGESCHFHLANSTRAIVPLAACARRGFLLTVHDVVPRAAALRPLQRAVVGPLCIRRAGRVIVHSEHAATLLTHSAGIGRTAIEVIPHPAAPPPEGDRASARAALGIADDGPPLFMLPGVLKPAKLVRETLQAASPLIASGHARLLLSGRVLDEQLPREAARAGAAVMRNPDQDRYDQAILAADAVISVRADSVGESNAPLLEAIGAGRASLITAVGSAPEVAGASARVVAPTPAGIRAGLEALLDPGERGQRAAAARERAAELTWQAAARRHIEVLEEVGLA
jgi:glycosyltransferase involved in cell wall biosynthesis